jgi:omega-amidase
VNPLRVAIAQLPMAWTVDGNVAAIADHLALAREADGDLALFPEMAVTGFHRSVPEGLTPAVVHGALERIRAECARHAIPAVVGTPFFAPGAARPLNAVAVIGGDGRLLAVRSKIGLTRSERTFFAPGGDRSPFSLGTFPAGVMLCREVRDVDELRAGLSGIPLLLWPGAICWDRGGGEPENRVTVDHARECAREMGAWVVQCNWAQTLNDPGARGMGGSLVVSPAGEVTQRCAFDAPGVTLAAIGE